jgi:hypothetical protein
MNTLSGAFPRSLQPDAMSPVSGCAARFSGDHVLDEDVISRRAIFTNSQEMIRRVERGLPGDPQRSNKRDAGRPAKSCGSDDRPLASGSATSKTLSPVAGVLLVKVGLVHLEAGHVQCLGER